MFLFIRPIFSVFGNQVIQRFVILKGSFVEINNLIKNKRALNDTISILRMFFQYS